MKPWVIPILTLLTLLGLPGVPGAELPGAGAQIVFEKDEVLLKPGVLEASVVAEFPFRNAGSYPVSVKSVHAGKKDQVERLPQRTYRPGESGVVRVALDTSRRQGTFVYPITFRTDEREAPERELLAHVDVPTVFEVEPAVLHWEVGEEAAEKEATVRIAEAVGRPVAITGTELIGGAARGGMEARVEEVEAGKTYRVFVRPRSTERPGGGLVRLDTDLPGAGTAPLLAVRAMVMPKRPERPGSGQTQEAAGVAPGGQETPPAGGVAPAGE